MKVSTEKSLFTAKVKDPVKKVPDKKVIKQPELGDKIRRFSDLKQTIEAATGELKMIEGDIKAAGRQIFMDEYKVQRRTPENFKIQDATGASVMFITMDKYTIVDQTKADVLSQFDGLLEEKVVYTINPDLVEKYAQVLSQLILNSPDIEEDDKTELISGEKSFSVKKGSIDRLLQYQAPDQIFELINPIVSLKK